MLIEEAAVSLNATAATAAAAAAATAAGCRNGKMEPMVETLGTAQSTRLLLFDGLGAHLLSHSGQPCESQSG